MCDKFINILYCICNILLVILILFGPIFLICYEVFHGHIDYNESNDKDLVRITSVTQMQNHFHTYYAVEVEYLTNTPVLQGSVNGYNIEKDIFYCYFEDVELVRKLKDNLYNEVWLISGYKGGYESIFDFKNKLIKDIELKL